MKELVGFHHLSLVVMSILLAICASYTAISLVSRVKGHTLQERVLLMIASVVMGGGVWGMHFTGMLAFHLDIQVTFDIKLVILSFLLAVVSSMISFRLIVFFEQKQYYLFHSSLILGFGIFGMHYLGMEAMVIEAEIQYEPIKFTLALIAAVTASWMAFWFFSKLKSNGIFLRLWIKVAASVFLGMAVSTMHYMGMSAANFTTNAHNHQDVVSETDSHFILASLIGVFIFLVLIIILVKSYMDEKATQKLKESEERYRSIVELAPYGIIIHSFGPISYVNPVSVQELGAKSKDELIGKHILDIIHPDYHAVIDERWTTIQKDEKVSFIEEKLIRMDGRIIDVEVMAIPYYRNGERQVQMFFRNITDKKRAEKLVYQLAYHDPLTGLPNRRLFLDRLNESLEDPKVDVLAVMFIDLDGFKQINDRYGHDAGDVLLKEVAKRLTNCMREEDTVARLAGDEFTILLPVITQQETIDIAQKMIDTLGAPVEIQDNFVHVTPSIGITFNDAPQMNAEALVKQADTAMYQAKKQGKNRYQIVK